MKKPTIDNTICTYAFSELALKQWQGSIKNATPCCNMLNGGVRDPMKIKDDLENNELTIEEIFNHKTFQNLRKQMLNGEKPESCQICFKSEELYKTSYRLSSAGFSEILTQEDIKNPKIRILDLNTGDSCNLRCRMCRPSTSNQLRIDSKLFKKNGFDYNSNQPNWWNINEYTEKNSENKAYYSADLDSKQWLDLKNNLETVRVIKASGGETLMSRSFIDFLDYAIKNDYAKNITLDFHTNGTKFNKPMLKRFEKFKKVNPDFSIDGIDKVFEYIRYPAKFSDLKQNLVDFYSSDVNTTKIQINFVLMSYNIHNLEDTIKWAIDFANQQGKFIKLHADLVNPIGRNIDIKWLPPEIILPIISSLEKYEDYSENNCFINIKKVINYMRESVKNYSYNEDMLKRFKEETVQFDLNRNQSYQNYCHPVLVEFLDSIII